MRKWGMHNFKLKCQDFTDQPYNLDGLETFTSVIFGFLFSIISRGIKFSRLIDIKKNLNIKL